MAWSLAGEALGYSRVVEVKAAEEPKYVVEPFVTAIYQVPQGKVTYPTKPTIVLPIVQIKTINKSWPVPSKEEAKNIITYWANFYGIDVQKALRITYCESGWYSQAKNRTSSAAGLYQFIRSTFNSTASRMGLPYNYEGYVFNAEVNAQMGAWLASQDGWSHWVCK